MSYDINLMGVIRSYMYTLHKFTLHVHVERLARHALWTPTRKIFHQLARLNAQVCFVPSVAFQISEKRIFLTGFDGYGSGGNFFQAVAEKDIVEGGLTIKHTGEIYLSIVAEVPIAGTKLAFLSSNINDLRVKKGKNIF